MMMAFFTIFELGMLMTKHVLFERSVDIAVRDVRLAGGAEFTRDQIGDMICAKAAIFPECKKNLAVELTVLNETSSNIPSGARECVDRGGLDDFVPSSAFEQGKENQTVYLRACMVVKPFFPGSALAVSLSRDATGRYAMVTKGAFAIEPAIDDVATAAAGAGGT
ncbi:hypothetical protein KIN_05670 [Litoreibacter roseus]|uniref:TadE-like protein n=2 Tax=Litoreibacter roseus TaxID=2601869 RepID=A0A6N6JB78_9RHOB|nr:hypothetical protein KIN_05670 [Litoreibacter roseus]